MKSLRKSIAPSSFVKIRSKLKGKSWEYFYKNYPDEHHVLTEVALADQDYECAYTGLPLFDKHRCCAHLDHFCKRSLYNVLTFEWSNIFAAYKGSTPDFGADFKDNHINDLSDYASLLNPLTDDVDRFFYYSTDGKIEPAFNLDQADKAKAEFTISTFCLNHPKLVAMRKDAMMFYRYIHPEEPDMVEQAKKKGFSFLLDFERRFS